jgi:hypothetical protein
MACPYEQYLQRRGISGRITGARAETLRRQHAQHHAETCVRQCPVCGAGDCEKQSCFAAQLLRRQLERHREMASRS